MHNRKVLVEVEMLDQMKDAFDFNPVDRIVGLFPNADPRIVSSLTSQSAALSKYLAEHNDLTLGEVHELLGAFVPVISEPAELRAAG